LTAIIVVRGVVAARWPSSWVVRGTPATFRFKVSLRRVAPRVRYARLPPFDAATGACRSMSIAQSTSKERGGLRNRHVAHRPAGPTWPAMWWCVSRKTGRCHSGHGRPRAGGASNHIRACDTPKTTLFWNVAPATRTAHANARSPANANRSAPRYALRDGVVERSTADGNRWRGETPQPTTPASAPKRDISALHRKRQPVTAEALLTWHPG
jgi:hypothetical protein